MHDSLAAAGTALIEAANDAGGKDNISVDPGARLRRRAFANAILVALPALMGTAAHTQHTAPQAAARSSRQRTKRSGMGKLVVSLDGVVIKEVQITKDKTTLGRRPYNDIVIDNLAVSGEHAVLQMVGNDVFIEDLNSTNGTYINGKAVKKQLLAHNDTVEIGKYKIKYLADDSTDYEKTMIMRPGAPPPLARRPFSPHPAAAAPASARCGPAPRQHRRRSRCSTAPPRAARSR